MTSELSAYSVRLGTTSDAPVFDAPAPVVAQDRAAAGDRDIVVAGGASVAQQYLAAGLLDEINLSVVPLLLGAGERLFDRLGGAAPRLEQVRVIEAPGVTHLRYRVIR